MTEWKSVPDLDRNGANVVRAIQQDNPSLYTFWQAFLASRDSNNAAWPGGNTEEDDRKRVDLFIKRVLETRAKPQSFVKAFLDEVVKLDQKAMGMPTRDFINHIQQMMSQSELIARAAGVTIHQWNSSNPASKTRCITAFSGPKRGAVGKKFWNCEGAQC